MLSLEDLLLTGMWHAEYIWNMVKQKKHKKQTTKANGTKVILMPGEETTAEEEDIDEEEDESGIYLEKEDVKIIYNALKQYKPADDDEEVARSTLLESFEEMLVVEYRERLPGFEFMDEEDE